MPRKLLTIPEVAHCARVSERTVRREIAAGRLSVIQKNRRVLRIAAADASFYCRRHRISSDWMTPLEAARRTGLCRRTIWNLISSGYLLIVARLTARRIFLSKREVRRKLRWEWQQRERAIQRTTQTTPVSEAIDAIQLAVARAGLPQRSYAYLTIQDLARLERKSVRAIYHDITKGVLSVRYRSARRILIDASTAAAYLGLGLGVHIGNRNPSRAYRRRRVTQALPRADRAVTREADKNTGSDWNSET